MSYGTTVKIGTIQRRLAWPLRKDDTLNREVSHFFFPFIQIFFFSKKKPVVQHILYFQKTNVHRFEIDFEIGI
jgi:hypothetical protein